MFKVLILLITVFVIYIIIRKPATKESENTETEKKDIVVTYVCTECGEKDCNCYKEDTIHKH